MLVIGAAVALVVARCGMAGNRSERLASEAAAALVRALDGDAAGFDEAERRLASAASLTDAYPLFALEATRRLRERRFADAAPEVRPVFEHLAARDFDRAEAAAAALPVALAGRAELVRFVAELRAARLAGSATPGR